MHDAAADQGSRPFFSCSEEGVVDPINDLIQGSRRLVLILDSLSCMVLPGGSGKQYPACLRYQGMGTPVGRRKKKLKTLPFLLHIVGNNVFF